MGLYTDLKKAGLLGSIRSSGEPSQPQAGTVLDRFMANNVRGPQGAEQTKPPWTPSVPPVAKKNEATPWVPRLPTLAELNKVEQTQRFLPNLAPTSDTSKASSQWVPRLPTLAEMNKVESSQRFLPNIASAQPAQKATPKLLLPVQGAIEGFANIPANISKSAQLVAHGIGTMAPNAIKGVRSDDHDNIKVSSSPVIETSSAAQRDRFLHEASAKADGVAVPHKLPGEGTSIPLGDRTRQAVERAIEGERALLGTPDLTSGEARLGYAIGGLVPNMLEWMSPTAAVSAPLAAAGRTGIETEQAGATMDEQFVNAAAAGILASALQRLGVSGEAGKLLAVARAGTNVSKSAIVSGMKAILKAGGEEALESVVETIVGNAVAKGTYDPTRKVINPGELMEEAGTGFLLGGLAGSPRATIGVASGIKDNRSYARQQQTIEKNMIRTPEAIPADHIGSVTPLAGKPPSTSLKAFGDVQGKDLQNAARAYAFREYQGKSFYNGNMGKEIIITRDGIEKTMSQAAMPQKSATMAILPELVRNAALVSEAPDGGRHPDVKRWFYLETPVDVDGIAFTAKIDVKETSFGNKFYIHRLNVVKGPTDHQELHSLSTDRYTPVTTVNPSDSITPPRNTGVKVDIAAVGDAEGLAGTRDAPAYNVLRTPYGVGRWTSAEMESMANGRTPIPTDIKSLQALADEVDTLSMSNPKGVTFDLQHFAADLNNRINVNLVEQHKLVKELKKQADKAYAAAPLNEYDDYILKRVKSGATLRNMMPGDANITAIESVLQAEDAYKEAQQVLIDHNTERKAKLFEQMGDLVAESNDWKDIKAGIVLAADTMERNMFKIAGELDGQRVNETLFRPVHENEAKGTRWLNKMRQPVRDLKLTKAESELVQLVGEKRFDSQSIEPGKPLRYQDAGGRERIINVPENTSRERIVNAVNTFRNLYDTMISQVNDVLAQNGYEPVEYRKDYFPHFEESTDPVNQALKMLGIEIESIELPTDISGLTNTFRPGRKWFQFAQQRQGDKTTYDALEGFDRYTQGIKDVVWHTFDIQRLRTFEAALRAKHSGAGYESAVKNIINDSSRPWEDRQKELDDMLTKKESTTKHSALALDIRQYTDNLAGKKSLHDRSLEADGGRSVIYNVLRNVQQRVARNMVVLNPASWFTNFISLVQGAAFIDTKHVLSANIDTIRSYGKDDGFAQSSTFLTNRRGSDPLSRNFWEATTDKLAAPMRIIDDITANILVRGKYKEGIDAGLSHKEAMRVADSFAAGTMADRSKGSLPTLFNRQNFLTKLFTQFQLEVNNQYRFILKDMPREARVKGSLWLAQGFLKMMLASYLYNELYEKFVGRRPAFDPIGIAIQAFEDRENPNLMVTNMNDAILNQTPFVGSLMGGGRLPIQAAFPTGAGLRSVREKFIDGDTKGAVKTLGKELSGPAAYLLPPVGGGQIKKTIQGVSAFARGESQTTSGGMRYPIPQTLGNLAKTAVFGQYATKEAREYFDEAMRPLSESQAERVRKANDPTEEYERIMAEREIDRAKEALRQARKEKETEAKIKALERRYQEVQEEYKSTGK